MNLDDNTVHELALLMQFPDSSGLAGLKIHSDAAAATVAAEAVPSYVTEAPAATVTTLENGVQVASVYGTG